MLISIISSDNLLDTQMKEKIQANLAQELNDIEAEVQSVSTLAVNISDMVGSTYRNMKLPEYEALFAKLIFSNEVILGSGIWFEPYSYDKNEQYVGPYIYKEGNEAVVTYAYSNAEYDYFAYEFYTNVVNAGRQAVFTEAYYDPVTDIVMSSCSAPIYDDSGRFIGVVTVDIDLTSIQNLVGAIQVGNTGKAILINTQGQFLYHQDPARIMEQSIEKEANESLAAAGTAMLKNKEGYTTYEAAGSKVHLYYDTLDLMGWTLGITVDDSELSEPINKLVRELVAVGIIVLVCVFIIILLLVSAISRQINKVKDFAVQLAAGNYMIDELSSKRRDELGAMGDSLNVMYAGNKDIMSKITAHAEIIGASSEGLKSSAEELSNQFKMIETLMHEVSMDMSNNSAATQQVNASIQEVNASVTLLNNEAEQSTELAHEIKGRAANIQTSSEQSFSRAQSLTKEHKESLDISMKQAEVVASINQMAEVIASIAKQINMLALNASIEAARAGEQGKGFSVVAGQIGELAGETSTAVKEIKGTITQVQDAFQGLLNDATSMLTFVTDTVEPDYSTFVDVAKQYGADASSIEEFSDKIAHKIEEIESIISDVSQAVQSIAESSQHTVGNSGEIMNSIDIVSGEIDGISEMAGKQEDVSNELNQVLGKFTLSE
mgnify:CR=1 FL=1